MELFPKRLERNFTLIEWVVAVALGSVLMVAIIWSVNRLVQGGSRTVAASGIESDAWRMLDRLTIDAQSLVRPSGNRMNFSTRIPEEGWVPSSWGVEAGGMLKPDDRQIGSAVTWGRGFTDERWGRTGGVWMAMGQGSATEPALKGTGPGVGAFSWYLCRMTLGSGPDARMAYCLMRGSANVEETFRAAYDLEDPVLSASLYPETPDIEHVMGLNVIDFGVRLWGRDPTDGSMRLLFPSEASRLGSGWQIGLRGSPAPGSGAMVLEVFVRVLDSDGARLIHELEEGTLRSDWWGIAERHSKVFSTRIPVEAES
ncbi:MAG: prepilin-type N-terminal cleavage/methylation domain-containing protein [Opitutales bacterium]|nr:prepilin-type N-terminal cleavage/methylation domain-containing protein [Opitutales bacterium]